MQHLLFFGWMALNGMLCYQIAKKQGADPIVWSMIGVMFGPLGLLFCWLRLRKRVQEPKQPTFVISQWENDHWHYLDRSKEKKGPFTLRQLRSCARRGEINPDTWVWCSDMDGWKRIGQLEGLTDELFPAVTSCA